MGEMNGGAFGRGPRGGGPPGSALIRRCAEISGLFRLARRTRPRVRSAAEARLDSRRVGGGAATFRMSPGCMGAGEDRLLWLASTASVRVGVDPGDQVDAVDVHTSSSPAQPPGAERRPRTRARCFAYLNSGQPGRRRLPYPGGTVARCLPAPPAREAPRVIKSEPRRCWPAPLPRRIFNAPATGRRWSFLPPRRPSDGAHPQCDCLPPWPSEGPLSTPRVRVATSPKKVMQGFS